MDASLQQLLSVLAAQEGAPAGGGTGDLLSGFFVPFVIVIAVLYLMVIRPATKERKQHQSMIEALKRGDDVVMTNGIYGKLTDMGTDGTATLEIARNVKIKVLRSAIAKKVEVKKSEADEPAKA
jgi:preprotein translocase subunit YajC